MKLRLSLPRIRVLLLTRVCSLLLASVLINFYPLGASTMRHVALVTVEPRLLAPSFTLKDQYDTARSYRFPRERVSVLLFGDREGSQQLEGWIPPLVERFDDRIDVQGVAMLSSVPRLARPIVRRIMKRQVKHPVMLDWSGGVSRSYGYENGKATLVVINRDGQVVYKNSGAASGQELAHIYSEINRAL